MFYNAFFKLLLLLIAPTTGWWVGKDRSVGAK